MLRFENQSVRLQVHNCIYKIILVLVHVLVNDFFQKPGIHLDGVGCDSTVAGEAYNKTDNKN